MNKVKTLTTTLALVLTVGAAQVQAQGILGRMRDAVKNVVPQMEQPADIPPANMTPQAIIANTPGLPTPEEWVSNGGHTEAFMAKIEELKERLDAYAAQGARQATQADVDKAVAAAERQAQQSDRQVQGMFGVNIDQLANMGDAERNARLTAGAQGVQGNAMAQAQQKMQVLYSLGLTDADFEKMDSMTDAQSEAYIVRRLKENGMTDAEIQRRLGEAGIRQMSNAEVAASERESRQLRAQNETLGASGNTIMAFMEQKEATDKKIEEAGQVVAQRILELWRKHKPLVTAAAPTHDEMSVAAGVITQAELDSQMRRYAAAIRDYDVAVYRVWLDYVGTAQGHLKFLMPYAQQADDAQVEQMRIGAARAGVAAEREGASMHTGTVAGQYLNITASQPDVNMALAITNGEEPTINF